MSPVFDGREWLNVSVIDRHELARSGNGGRAASANPDERTEADQAEDEPKQYRRSNECWNSAQCVAIPFPP